MSSCPTHACLNATFYNKVGDELETLLACGVPQMPVEKNLAFPVVSWQTLVTCPGRPCTLATNTPLISFGLDYRYASRLPLREAVLITLSLLPTLEKARLLLEGAIDFFFEDDDLLPIHPTKTS